MEKARDGRLPPAPGRGGLAAPMMFLLAGCSSAGGIDAINPTRAGASSGDMGGAEGPSAPAFGSVCGFAAPVALGAPAADGFVDVPPAHPDILYFGRVDGSNPRAPQFAFPGVSIRMRFRGDAIDLRLKDFGKGTPGTTNDYDVIFDDGAPQLLRVSPSQQVYPIGRNLGAGEHTVEVWKRIESAPGGAPGAGKGQMLGFRLPEGGAVLPLAPRPHRIEFIGDSITCGYGDLISVADPSRSPYTTAGSNAALAYGAVAARRLNAEYAAVAYSGRGVYRNYLGAPGDTLPRMYGRSLPDDPTAAPWNTAAWTPDVVVINLGTNDFSEKGTDRSAFRAAYLAFLATLRSYYPRATFILAAGPMISDEAPAGEMAWTKIQADLWRIAASRTAVGDPRVHVLIMPPQSPPYGEDFHPTAATHASMADLVVALVKRLENW